MKESLQEICPGKSRKRLVLIATVLAEGSEEQPEELGGSFQRRRI
jgi:hypothetical protein